MNKVLWSPSLINLKKSKMALFMSYVNQEYNLSINDYFDLHEWSIDNTEDFWCSVSEFLGIYYHTNPTKIVENKSDMFNAKWFVSAKLNYAENMLKHGNNVISHKIGINCDFPVLGVPGALKTAQIVQKPK